MRKPSPYKAFSWSVLLKLPTRKPEEPVFYTVGSVLSNVFHLIGDGSTPNEVITTM